MSLLFANLLLENAVAVGAIGAVVVTFAAIVFLARRTGKAAAALATAIVITLLLLTVERLVVTDREQIETALQETLDAIETNDLDALLAHIDSQAAIVRADAEAALPLIRVETTGASQIETEFSGQSNTGNATTRFQGLLKGTSKNGGVVIPYLDKVEVTWVKRDKRWLIDGYTIYNKGKPINAVQRLRAGN